MLTFQVILIILLVGSVLSTCIQTSFWHDVFRPDVPSCNRKYYYMQGLLVGKTTDKNSTYLEGAQCCYPDNREWDTFDILNENPEWKKKHEEKGICYCPGGYFLSGFFRNKKVDKSDWRISTMGRARCIKPAAHPIFYGDCYLHNTSDDFRKNGSSLCKDGYFIVGLRVSNVNEFFIKSIECCTMALKPQEIKDFEQLKVRIMNRMLSNIATLARFLGYMKCSSDNGIFCGEDFELVNHTWHARGGNEKRNLEIVFEHWNLRLNNMAYGEIKSDMLDPDTIDSGTIVNNANVKVAESFEISKTVADTVTNVETNTLTMGHEAAFSFKFSIKQSLKISLSFKFTHKSSKTDTSQTDNVNFRTFTRHSKVNMDPFSAANYKVIVSKSKTTIPYTATVIATFSVRLIGNLMLGDKFSGILANYHHFYQGLTVYNYEHSFGNEHIPFYKALAKDFKYNTHPWLWKDLKKQYMEIDDYIKELTNEKNFEFNITGYMEKVSGTNIDVIWESVNLNKKQLDDSAIRRHDLKPYVALPSPADPPQEPNSLSYPFFFD